MSVQTRSAVRSPATVETRSFWDRWRRPHITEVKVSALADIPDVLACYRQNTGRSANSTFPPHLALVARWKGTPVGGAVLHLQDRSAVVGGLYVDAAWRGEDVGQRLLQRLVQHARRQFMRTIYAVATVDDAGFYALHGFRPVDEQAVSPGVLAHVRSVTSAVFAEDGILMRRELTPWLVNVPYDGFTVKM